MEPMKKSNALILAGVGITLLSMIAYDIQLKAEYESGRYKIPYQNFQSMPFRDFDMLDLQSSTAANVKFVQGPYSVRIEENATNYVKVKQEGRVLKIAAVFDGDYQGNPEPYTMIISCPNIVQINAGASYLTNGRVFTDSFVREDWKMRQVLVEGFKQDSLSIIQDYASTIILDSNQIRSIHAVLGKSPRSGSNLIIDKTNHFQNAFIDVGQISKFFLKHAAIDHLQYNLGDSAQLIVIGKANNLIDNK